MEPRKKATGNLNGNNRGFTLIELMITVAILGILASMAMPTYLKFNNNAKRVQGTALLSEIVRLEQIFYAENSLYTDSTTALGLFLLGQEYYTIVITTPSGKQTYLATASANLDTDGVIDVLTADQTTQIIIVSKD